MSIAGAAVLKQKKKANLEEAKKCILVCSNCHKEFHAGLWNLDELNLKEMEEVEPNGID